MLYIFRYFKEIQISIFVIKTMFELFWLVRVVIKCVRIFHPVCLLAHSVLLYQSSPVSFALCSHSSVGPCVSLCGVFTPNEPSVSVPALSETPDPALNFAVWGNWTCQKVWVRRQQRRGSDPRDCKTRQTEPSYDKEFACSLCSRRAVAQYRETKDQRLLLLLLHWSAN